MKIQRIYSTVQTTVNTQEQERRRNHDELVHKKSEEGKERLSYNIVHQFISKDRNHKQNTLLFQKKSSPGFNSANR